MFGIGPATRIYLACGATDMRKGFEGLFALAHTKMAEDPLSGHVFVFCNRLKTRVKVLLWDGSGLWICSKRLARGRFSWPEPGQEQSAVTLNAQELAMLLGGIDMSRAQRKQWWRAESGPSTQKPS